MADILDSFLTIARTDPARPFLSVPGGEGLSYGAAAERAGALAAALGVEPGARVAVQLPKSPLSILLYLACLWRGAVYLPLNPAYTLSETLFFLEDAETAVVVADGARLAELAAQTLPGRAIGPESLAPAMAQAPTPANADTLAAILYTSGTTGRAKGVMLTRGNLSSNAQALVTAWEFGAGDVLLHVLPVFHTHGLFVATNTVIMCGAQMLFLPEFTPAATLAALPRATVMMGVPTHYLRLLGDPGLTRAACAHMRVFISGSAPLSAATHGEWQARTGHAILERYGMTETNMITSNPYAGERRAGTVGMALPGISLRVVDAAGAPLPPGTPGAIEVKGPNVFAGYWRAPEKTAAEFRPDGFFITGDTGAVDGDGYLRILGRNRDLVITGGMNVYPAEVEDVIDALPEIAMSAVIGLPHPDLGEAVVAVVVARAGAEVTTDSLRSALRGRLSGYKLPLEVICLPDLPRNAMGKIQKNLLRDTHRAVFSPGADTD
jgi:malonyl-CoA/methylmalonyl-CoA synthetase